jgi:hypothetical protein
MHSVTFKDSVILKDGNGHGHGANGDDDRVKLIRKRATIYHNIFLPVCKKGSPT